MSTTPSTPTPTTMPIFTTMVEPTVDAAMPPLIADDDLAAKKAGPGGKHDSMRTYSPEEAALVFKLVEAHAPRWTHIAKLVSEATKQPRTAASVRNYYKRFCQSKKIADRDAATKKLNRCQMCGQIKRGHICTGNKEVEFEVPKSLKTENSENSGNSANPSSAAAAAAAPAAAAPVTAPQVLLAPTPPAQTAGGLVLSAGKGDDEGLPPLAPAALQVLMPGAALTHSPAGLSTPGPLSLSMFSMLGSPTALAALGLPTPASMPPSVAAAAAAAFPFAPRPGSAIYAEVVGDDEDQTMSGEGEVAEALGNATNEISALPMATAEVN